MPVQGVRHLVMWFLVNNYLTRIGFPISDLMPTPADDRAVVHGINNARFTPIFEVDLQWSHQSDMRINRGRFIIVHEAPFELLFGSQGFVDGLRTHLPCPPLV